VVKERIDRGGMREQENIDDHIILKWERKKSKKKRISYCLLEVVATSMMSQ